MLPTITQNKIYSPNTYNAFILKTAKKNTMACVHSMFRPHHCTSFLAAYLGQLYNNAADELHTILQF